VSCGKQSSFANIADLRFKLEILLPKKWGSFAVTPAAVPD
jgi:hypothetical protein